MERASPWTEFVGIIKRASESTIALSCCKQVKLHVREDQLRKWSNLLRKSSLVGILILDDGTIRVRRIGTARKGVRFKNVESA